jgi:hypothetical protein
MSNLLKLVARALLAVVVLSCVMLLVAARAEACDREPNQPEQHHDHDHDHDRDDDRDRDHDRPDVVDAAPGRASQDAMTTTAGTAVADTGANIVVAEPRLAEAAGVRGARSAAAALAAGGVSTTQISQRADAHATANATVDIVQIAAVVNIGVAHAGSADDAPNAPAPSAPSAPSAISSGDATAVGQVAQTTIRQRVAVGTGERAAQHTTVVNVGVGVANTGLNVAIGGGSTTTTRSTNGDAIAVGNITSTTLDQRAAGIASGAASLTIDQRAFVVNFGVALANSGGNVVNAADNARNPNDGAVARSLWAVLAPLMRTPAVPVVPNSGGAPGSIATGTAVAVGNAASTDVLQSATGAVVGSGSAEAHQATMVGNAGLALANTGLNASVGGLPPPGTVATTSVASELARFLQPLTNLDWLRGPNPFTVLGESLRVGDLLVELSGRFDGTVTNVDGSTVRQVTAVLDVQFAFAEAPAPAATVAYLPDTNATLRTGNASALGNRATIAVCQTLNVADRCRGRTET